MFSFYYQQSGQRRKLHQVQGGHCTIGSARGNDLVIKKPGMSKRHAELRLESDGLYLEDMGSIAGCRVNNERVHTSGPLTELDEILIGDIRVTVRGDHQIRSDMAPRSASEQPGAADMTNAAIQKPAKPATESSEASVAEAGGSEMELSHWGRTVHEQLLEQMDLRRKDVNRMSDQQLREESLLIIQEIVAALDSQLPDTIDREALQQYVLNESVGLGPLELFLADESISEIMVNNHREIFVERDGQLQRSAMQFSSDATVMAVIDRIITPLGRRVDESSPIVDARLKDGSRVNAVIPPLALKGPCLTIRKFPTHRIEFQDLIDKQALTADMLTYLQACVEQRKNIIVAGGTGSGKTTLLNILSRFIPDTDRVVTIEDAAELQLVQPNLISLESRPANLEGKGSVPIRDLVKNALRMRPDRIVVGECRGGEALDMLQAMNTGHDGSLTTLHANSPRDALSRLEVLVLMAGMDLPVRAIREQVASAVDVILQQHRFACGARKITRITEVSGMESGTIQLQDVFVFNRSKQQGRGVTGQFETTGVVPQLYEDLLAAGTEVDLSCFQQTQESLL